MLKSTFSSIVVLMMIFVFNANLHSQQCEVITNNIVFESDNSLTFDVYLNNTGTSSFTYSHGSFVWTYDTAILNGGTPTFSLVPGYSDFSTGAYPPSALITSPNILRTSSNMPGSNGVIPAGESLRLYRFRLQTSASSFSSDYFDISWKNDVTPSAKIYSWNNVSGLPEEIQNLEFSVLTFLLEENFDYSIGDLTTVSGGNWVAYSGTGNGPAQVSTGSLSYTGYLSSGLFNKADISSTGAEDAYIGYTPQGEGITTYSAFLLNVTNTDGLLANGTDGNYFYSYLPSNSTSYYNGRLYIRLGTVADTYQLGLRANSSATILWDATDYNIATTVLIVLSYESITGTANDVTSLWINPPVDGSMPPANLTETCLTDNIDAARFALRQSAGTPNASIDGIRVATSWSEIFPAAGTPLITVSPTSLSGFSYVQGGGPSASQSYDLSGSDLTPTSGNITVNGSENYEVSLNNTTFSTSVNVPYSGGTLVATPIYVRLKAGLVGGEYNGELITNGGGGATTQNVICNGSVIKGEPTNHVTNFTGVLGNPAYYYNNLSWTDATGGTVPDGYLVKRSYISFNAIVNPIDGVPEDSSFEQNVAQGVQAVIFGGYAGSTYYYKIFPYTNSGPFINYKIDGSVPQFSITNANAPVLPITENFEYTTGSLLTDNGWVAHSGAGTNPIMVNANTLTYSGYVNSGLGKSITLNGTGEDDNRAFDSVYSGSVYASFMVNVESATTSGVYFFHFAPENSFNYRARVYVQNDGSDNLAFGISIGANTADYTLFNYSLNTTYLIVVKYTFNTTSTNDDEVKLWINPILNGIEPASDLTQTDPTQSDVYSLGAFDLRQGSGGPILNLGGIRVATTWVPEAGTTTFQLTVNVTNGWNMVSVPGINPDGMGVNTWWVNRDPLANVFKYAGGYQPVSTTATGIGYWMKHSGAQTYNTGDEWPAGGIQIVAHDPITAASGWNLFGGYETSVATSGLTTNPPGLITGSVYKYSGGYQVATTLDPGYGYWVKLTGAGSIIIPAALVKGKSTEFIKEGWGKIVFTDATGINYTLYAVKGEVDLNAYELPPAPPEGMFDIRFSSDKIAEDINSSVKTINMSGVTYPLTVKAENMDMRIMDETGKLINMNLKKGEDIVINDATIQKLMISGELIPDKYALEQNYPNPFNPSTIIKFSLPENVGNVRLTIYNTLGEKIAEIVNTSLQAGTYSYQWNAGNAATGMYIYELRTDKFVSVKKMLLLK